jgi:hypothetical protein
MEIKVGFFTKNKDSPLQVFLKSCVPEKVGFMYESTQKVESKLTAAVSMLVMNDARSMIDGLKVWHKNISKKLPSSYDVIKLYDVIAYETAAFAHYLIINDHCCPVRETAIVINIRFSPINLSMTG